MGLMDAGPRRLEKRKCAAREAVRTAANAFGASPRAEAGQTPITKQCLRG
jgi:hypothetical protein